MDGLILFDFITNIDQSKNTKVRVLNIPICMCRQSDIELTYR